MTRRYWDTAAFLGLLNDEPDKIASCRAVIREAEAGKLEIVTSTLTLVEVLWPKGGPVQLASERAADLHRFFEHEWITLYELDRTLAEEAVAELAAFPAREVSALVLALDRGWPAIALVLALEERPRFFTTALTDEETQRLVAWLTRDPAAGFLAELTFELTGSGPLMARRGADPRVTLSRAAAGGACCRRALCDAPRRCLGRQRGRGSPADGDRTCGDSARLQRARPGVRRQMRPYPRLDRQPALGDAHLPVPASSSARRVGPARGRVRLLPSHRRSVAQRP